MARKVCLCSVDLDQSLADVWRGAVVSRGFNNVAEVVITAALLAVQNDVRYDWVVIGWR